MRTIIILNDSTDVNKALLLSSENQIMAWPKLGIYGDINKKELYVVGHWWRVETFKSALRKNGWIGSLEKA